MYSLFYGPTWSILVNISYALGNNVYSMSGIVDLFSSVFPFYSWNIPLASGIPSWIVRIKVILYDSGVENQRKCRSLKTFWNKVMHQACIDKRVCVCVCGYVCIIYNRAFLFYLKYKEFRFFVTSLNLIPIISLYYFFLIYLVYGARLQYH